ncbi:MAG: hypothetical protein ABI354_00095 [Candidatus Saccharimonadales bacterium]
MFKKPNKATPKTRRSPSTPNRTAAFSYYNQKRSPSDLNVGRKRQGPAALIAVTSSRIKRRHLPELVAWFAIVVAIMYSLTLQTAPRINVVSQPGTVSRSPEVYKDDVQSIWQSSFLNRSKLTVKTGDIRGGIQKQFPEIVDIDIELPLLGRRPAITLTTAAPAFVLSSTNGSFYVDRNGKVLALVKDVSKNNVGTLIKLIDETQTHATPGRRVVSQPAADYLIKLNQLLSSAHLNVDSITMPPKAANEADVRITGEAYFVKFLIGSNEQQGVGALVAVQAKLDNDHVTPKEYIDLRVDEKAFYR